MQRERKSGPAIDSNTRCEYCLGLYGQPLRHRHFLDFSSDALARHIEEQQGEEAWKDGTIGALIAWCNTMRQLYGGMVDEQGQPLSVWQARQIQHAQYAKVYQRSREPRTEKGRQVTFQVFRILLASTKSPHARAWLEMLDAQFPSVPSEEAQWKDFVGFMTEYEHSASDENNAEYTQRPDTHRVLALIQNKMEDR